MCIHCDEFNQYVDEVYIDVIYINNIGYQSYDVPIIYCPYCGKKIKDAEGTE